MREILLFQSFWGLFMPVIISMPVTWKAVFGEIDKVLIAIIHTAAQIWKLGSAGLESWMAVRFPTYLRLRRAERAGVLGVCSLRRA